MKARLPIAALTAAVVLMCTACATAPQPAPAPPEPPAPELSFSLLEQLSADGLFAFGKASIDDFSAEGRATLDRLAQRLAERPLEMVHVIGHSDRIGSDQANLRLSTARAQAVRDYLVERGVPADRITAVGRGSVQPVVECDGESGDALVDCLAPNRRVELSIRFAS